MSPLHSSDSLSWHISSVYTLWKSFWSEVMNTQSLTRLATGLRWRANVLYVLMSLTFLYVLWWIKRRNNVTGELLPYHRELKGLDSHMYFFELLSGKHLETIEKHASVFLQRDLPLLCGLCVGGCSRFAWRRTPCFRNCSFLGLNSPGSETYFTFCVIHSLLSTSSKSLQRNLFPR